MSIYGQIDQSSSIKALRSLSSEFIFGCGEMDKWSQFLKFNFVHDIPALSLLSTVDCKSCGRKGVPPPHNAGNGILSNVVATVVL